MGIFSFLFGKPAAAQPASRNANAASAGRDLRRMMLSTPAKEFGVEPSTEFPRVYGVLMDWPIDDDTATVFATSTGAASLYTTSTFGIIGGEGHASVRAAAMAFVKYADGLYDTAAPTSEFPYPDKDRVRFYLLTFGGVRVIDTDLASILDLTSKYTEYFDLGQKVLTELRMVTENR